MRDPDNRPANRPCYRCRYYHWREQDGTSWCTHPAYRIPVRWKEAIERGQPCGADNAPLWEARGGSEEWLVVSGMRYFFLLILGAYLAFWGGLAVHEIGIPRTECRPVDPQFPMVLIAVLGIPAVLGFMAGRKSSSRSHAPRGNAVLPLQRPVTRPDAGASAPAPTLERGSQRGGARFETLMSRMWPMCPRGGHRQRGELIRNEVSGTLYCWHPDCIRASWRDVVGG